MRRLNFLPSTGIVCLQSMAPTNAVKCARKKGIDKKDAALGFMLGQIGKVKGVRTLGMRGSVGQAI